MRGTPRRSMVAFPLQAGFMIGKTVNEFGSLVTMGMIGPQSDVCLVGGNKRQKPRALHVKMAAKRA